MDVFLIKYKMIAKKTIMEKDTNKTDGKRNIRRYFARTF